MSKGVRQEKLKLVIWSGVTGGLAWWTGTERESAQPCANSLGILRIPMSLKENTANLKNKISGHLCAKFLLGFQSMQTSPASQTHQSNPDEKM